MKPSAILPRVFASGERVEPGIYQDIDSGATITVHQPDELPEDVRIIRIPRRFMRIDAQSLDVEFPALPHRLVSLA